jgi:transcriptional regulator with XRE-family HTH domain
MYDIFEKLCVLNNVTPYRVCKETGITTATISNWKAGRYVPKQDKMKKIADFFGVSVDYLMTGTTGNNVGSPCPDCGLWYDPDDVEDVKFHTQQHAAWEKATEKFGKLYCNYVEREKIKAVNRNVSHNTSLPLSERHNAQINVLRCLFSRSVEANHYNLNHVPFETYVAMMLGNGSYKKNNLEDDLFSILSESYGTLPGISNGSIYHMPESKVVTMTKKDGRDIRKDLDSIMKKLSSGEEGPAAFDGEELSPESAELFRGELEIALKRLKLLNKDKYTPKKYKR